MYNKLFLIIHLTYCLRLNETINVKLIPEYIWDSHRGRVAECHIPCEFSAEPKNPDAEFYIVMHDGNVRDIINSKSDNPIKILGALEPQHYYHLLKIEFLKHHFQATSLLDRRSDIPWVIMPDMDKVKAVERPKNPKPKASYVARNCNPMNNRNDYVKAVDEVIGVVAPSNCFQNTEWPSCNGNACTKVEAIRDYKIHLAFENGDSPGFITDKIYQPMEAGVLPVWMGTRDVADVVPKGSYIDVAEFDTPHDVANYLKMVLENETLYSYFEWKDKPFEAEFEASNRVLWGEDHYCHVCYYVDAVQRGVGWDHFYQRAVDRISPSKLKVTGKQNKTKQTNSLSKEQKSERLGELKLEVDFPLRKLPHCDSSQSLPFKLTIIIAILTSLMGLVILFRKVFYKFRFPQ